MQNVVVRIFIQRHADRGHFAEAVGNHEVIAGQLFPEHAQLRFRGRRTCQVGTAQAGKGIGAEILVVHQRDDHRGHGVQQRTMLVVHRPDQRIRANVIRHEQYGVGHGAGEEADHQPQDVEQRYDQQVHVFLCKPLHLHLYCGGVQQVVGGQYDALRLAGGAGGEDHHAGCVRVNLVFKTALQCLVFIEAGAQIQTASNGITVADLAALDTLDGGEERHVFLHTGDFTVAEGRDITDSADFADLLRALGGIHQHGDGPQLLHGVECDYPVDGVACAYANVRPLSHAQHGQIAGDDLRCAVDVRPGKGLALVLQNHHVTRLSDMARQQFLEGHVDVSRTILRRHLNVQYVVKTGDRKHLHDVGGDVDQPTPIVREALGANQKLAKAGGGNGIYVSEIQRQQLCVIRYLSHRLAQLGGGDRVNAARYDERQAPFRFYFLLDQHRVSPLTEKFVGMLSGLR